MIGLDTNVLVRYLTQDDPVQSPKATEVIERRLTEKNPGFVSVVAIVETVWVLERVYGLTTSEIVDAVERMLQIDVLVLENEQDLRYYNHERPHLSLDGLTPVERRQAYFQQAQL